MAIEKIGPAGIGATGPAGGRPAARAGQPTAAAFGEALQRASEDLQLSRHAQKRIERRELGLDRGRLDRLNDAITSAAAKGARNSVVVLDELAVVVDVRQRTVITAMNREEGGRNRVFTNIDSVVIA